jgi:endo-1,4-beta-xylanase
MIEFTRRDCLSPGLALGAAGCVSNSAGSGDPGRAAGTAPGSLNALARAKGLVFGTCIGTGPSGAPRPASLDGKRANSFADVNVREIAVRECGMLVPENELKWYALRPTPEGFDFARADKLMAFAAQNKMMMRGHTLLWHHMNWFPPWVKDFDFGARPAEAAERMLREHIATVCGHYGARIVSWDVINETIEDDTGAMRQTVFTRYLSDRVVDIAFQATREGAPNAQLVYNDYMGWGEGGAKHRAGVLKLLEGMRARGLPVDALGVQSHISTDKPDTDAQARSSREREWRRFLDEVVGLGLDLVITELDVRDNNSPADFALRDGAVADCARAYLDLMLSYRQTKYVMAWGLVDRYSWLQDRWPRADGLPKRCCPYDDVYRPKLLREAIAGAFRAAPNRA